MARKGKKFQDEVSYNEDKKTTSVVYGKSNFGGRGKPNSGLLTNEMKRSA